MLKNSFSNKGALKSVSTIGYYYNPNSNKKIYMMVYIILWRRAKLFKLDVQIKLIWINKKNWKKKNETRQRQFVTEVSTKIEITFQWEVKLKYPLRSRLKMVSSWFCEEGIFGTIHGLSFEGCAPFRYTSGFFKKATIFSHRQKQAIDFFQSPPVFARSWFWRFLNSSFHHFL